MLRRLVLCCGALAPISTVAADVGHTERAAHGAPAHQVMRGDDGWELEVHSSPAPATVGHLVQLAIWLRKDGAVFPGLTEVAIAVANQEEAQTVMGTHILAPQGHTAQSLQLYDGAPHTITVTVRPVGEEASGVAPLTAVLGLDVVASDPGPDVHGRVGEESGDSALLEVEVGEDRVQLAQERVQGHKHRSYSS